MDRRQKIQELRKTRKAFIDLQDQLDSMYSLTQKVLGIDDTRSFLHDYLFNGFGTADEILTRKEQQDAINQTTKGNRIQVRRRKS